LAKKIENNLKDQNVAHYKLKLSLMIDTNIIHSSQ